MMLSDLRPGMIQVSLCTGTESSMGAFRITKNAKFLHAANRDSDQTAWMRKMIFHWEHMSEGTFSHVAAHLLRAV